MTPRRALVPVMDHEIHVTEWGDPAAPALVMWHGLARTGRDFDELAAAMARDHFVLCPDTPGRGLSSWAVAPEAEYSITCYTGIATDLLDHYGVQKADWLGTSMGGMIGMRLASGPQGDRLRGLILNDIGPELPEAAVQRILDYVGDLPRFDTIAQAEAWLRRTYQPFGEASDAFWRRMALTSTRRQADGSLTLHYDPAIIQQFTCWPEELTCWDRWERITTPCHLIRGADSDLLTPEIAARMTRSGPRPVLTEIPGCGHAPTLSRAEDIALLREILTAFRTP
ncbi:alpha/beta fold hydrolase [Pseudooceanicola algae]|uniref:2-succinyl-6-hydroxy-2, 4-cyclohexadiene-1-carboxylate synthase n=1 Tax=Pseudooceanicola algae TaxID=1537215 RepID=A0A418SGW3_9RHOB|nr:alpha/beta hydrolase [Pseudooceanicola algae]QPM88832.1 2-succinyl-6-hydroxy-2,4-cyclohexadiene-1-carboxylate synthase [Pseudooceanicola algae]